MVGHFNKRKATGPVGFTVDDEAYANDFAKLREKIVEFFLRGGVGEVANVDVHRHVPDSR